MKLSVCLAFALVMVGTACEYDVPPTTPPVEPGLDAQVRQLIGNWGVIPIGEMPPQDSDVVALGRALFFDPILSGNRDISCGTCHDPALAMGDGMSLGVGTGFTGEGAARLPGAGRQFLPRSVPSLLNQGLRAYQVFWDGRVSGFGTGPFDTPVGNALPSGLDNIVAAQAMLPVLSRQEMRGSAGDLDRFGNANELAQIADDQYAQVWAAVMQRVMAIPAYVSMFTAAFPGTPAGSMTFRHAATAIAIFQFAELTRANTSFDRFLKGENGAMSTEAKLGALQFFGEARCSFCHNGALLGGVSFANVGVPQIGPGTGTAAPLDLGRGALINQEFYRFNFRAPPLRNVELTAPYFHNGAYATLDAVVEHYSDVETALRTYNPAQLTPAVQALYHGDLATVNDVSTNIDFSLRPRLDLSDEEQAQLVAFLKSLTDPAARNLTLVAPATVPSGLPVR